MNFNISVINGGLTCQTAGLSAQLGYEIEATVNSPLLQEECCAFLLFVGKHLAGGSSIQNGDTIRYGYWLTKAQLEDGRPLSFYEWNAEMTKFVHGVSVAVTYWRDQNMICDKVGASFCPPHPEQMVVISDGVYEGDAVEGVRYPSPDHMSGWWLTTDRYNGDVSTLKTVHAHHISATRSDLGKFLALPFGYRFYSPQSDVWFDQKVANAKP